MALQKGNILRFSQKITIKQALFYKFCVNGITKRVLLYYFTIWLDSYNKSGTIFLIQCEWHNKKGNILRFA